MSTPDPTPMPDILDELRKCASGDSYLPNSLAEDAAREIAALRASNEIMREASLIREAADQERLAYLERNVAKDERVSAIATTLIHRYGIEGDEQQVSRCYRLVRETMELLSLPFGS